MSFLQSYELADPAGGDPSILAQEIPMAAFALDAATGDLENPPRIIRGIDAYIQRLRCRLKFFRREWFLDLREGIPYFRDILTKDPSLQIAESVFRRAIMSVPCTLEVMNLRLDADRRNRILRVEGFEIRVGPPSLVLRSVSSEAFLVLP